MSQLREEQIEAIVEAALAVDREQRPSVLAERCGNDAALRSEVEAIIAGHDASNGFLESPASRIIFGEDDDFEPGSRYVGQTIGRYHVTRVIGIGGMGAVFEAQQKQPHRSVALKLMRQGMCSHQAMKRFRYEAEILGSLNHPNIAQIYDAGMHDSGTGGVPYFAMEYIADALPVTEYAARHELPINDRLELFIKICHAVHYGHQKGITHRDLKPANLVVDEHGEPKVIDFGVARATESDLTLSSIATEIGHLLGTAQYMSPEQCDGHVDRIDIRSDVYSLGVILHELLTGESPYAESIETLFDAMRVIRDGGPRSASSIAQSLRGNLQTILLKAMAKQPEDRYQSAAALVDDLRRHLAGEPIDARPPSRWQQAVRWVGRHPIMATTCLCIVIACMVLSLTAVSIWHIGYRPYDVVLSPSGREATLLSFAGHALHTWRTDAPSGIRVAELVDVPKELGGGQLVLIGYTSDVANPHPASLCAFQVSRRITEPLWIGRIEYEDLPDQVQSRGIGPEEFSVGHISLANVFPDHVGPQIVADHRHNPYTPTALRIYDLAGTVLYQVWHDGYIHDSHWLEKADLLVLAGLNGLVYWEDRVYGHPDELRVSAKVAHPRAIFAIRPQYGHRSVDWICPDRKSDDTIEPAWYRCVLPPAESHVLRGWRLVRPRRSKYVGRGVVLKSYFSGELAGAIDFLIDEFGQEVREARVVGDPYWRAPDMPDPDIFTIGDLPSLRAGTQIMR